MFILQETPIDTAQARKHSKHPQGGALVSFEGIVRPDAHDGNHVTALLYMADNDACRQEGVAIINEAMSLFPILDALCVQRVGRLDAGETAVWVGVWAGHRDEAFKANRYIIEEIKKRLLIWKKEFFKNGSSQWVRGKQSSVIL